MIAFCHGWLKDNEDVAGKKPAYVSPLGAGVDLELYTGPAHGKPDGWITAVVAVRTKKYIYRHKYDGGPMQGDGLAGMAKDCVRFIRMSYNLDVWRADAEKEYKRQIPAWRRFLNI